METVKNAVGLGKESQQGEEPVSGQQGEGTAVKPFDAGNQEGTHLPQQVGDGVAPASSMLFTDARRIRECGARR